MKTLVTNACARTQTQTLTLRVSGRELSLFTSIHFLPHLHTPLDCVCHVCVRKRERSLCMWRTSCNFLKWAPDSRENEGDSSPWQVDPYTNTQCPSFRVVGKWRSPRESRRWSLGLWNSHRGVVSHDFSMLLKLGQVDLTVNPILLKHICRLIQPLFLEQRPSTCVCPFHQCKVWKVVWTLKTLA
jgi:hypothetical protein